MEQSHANVLAVVAHPDDEALGPGGTLAARAAAGESVHVLVLCGSVQARAQKPSKAVLAEQLARSCDALGVASHSACDFANVRMNAVPAIELVQAVEEALRRTRAEIVYTHFSADVNEDHGATFRAALAAVRLPERHPSREDLPLVRALYAFETPASTDWSWRSGPMAFHPTTYVDVGSSFEQRRLASSVYEGVTRAFPHPISVQAHTARARSRGAEACTGLAEAHVCIFRRGLTDPDRNGLMLAIGRSPEELFACAGGTLLARAETSPPVVLLPKVTGSHATALLPGTLGLYEPGRLAHRVAELAPSVLLVPSDELMVAEAVRAARSARGAVTVLAYQQPGLPAALQQRDGVDVVSDIGPHCAEKLSGLRDPAQRELHRFDALSLGASFSFEAAEGFDLVWERQCFERRARTLARAG